ncbi:MAG: DUF2066 domain-containing protein [Gammaproteobacteria bacterium]|nr:DUF2066 domain-containing protein [Gammaproteobacteria bacterium]
MKSESNVTASRSWHAALVAVVLLLAMTPAVAIEVPTLYTAEVPFDRKANDPRGDAYRAALNEILLRVSGSELASNAAAVEALFPDPAAYVMQFRPGADDTFWVSFDGQAIEQVLRNGGHTFWGAERPLTLVWLAVDWGQGRREIISADDPDRTSHRSRSIDRNRLLRERLVEVAQRRGLPLVFPLLDTTDLQGISFADIWGGFDEPVLDASQRYDVNSVLIGRVRPSSGQRSRWTYYFSGAESAMSGAPEAVLGQVADVLAAEFAVGGDSPLEAVALSISGVVSVEAYGSVQGILKDISLIEDFLVTEVAGDRVSYRVEVRGGADRLARALRFNGLIEQDSFDPVSPAASLEFYYSP